MSGKDGGKARPQKPKRLLWGRALVAIVCGFFAFTIGSVALHRFMPVPVTSLMLQRSLNGEGIDHRWVPMARISDHLKTAVIAAEDAKFCEHSGFDWDAIEKAQRHNARSKRKRGASTISQQTAKNAFLWSNRSWVRKGVEVYYTFLIETLWPKSRILEVYLNSAEWGPGVYGAEAAARYWFDKPASKLTRAEAAKLAAILPSPLKWKAANSGRYVRGRASRITANANLIVREGIADCVVD